MTALDVTLECLHDSEYITIYHGKLDRKDSNYVKQTSYDKNELFN